MVANLNRDAGYTNATAFFSSKLIVDNKGGSIYVWRAEDRGQRTEDRGQRTEDRGQRTEDRGQRTENRVVWLRQH